MKKNRAFLWLIPIPVAIIIDFIILARVFKSEFNSIAPGESGHLTGMGTAFAAVILLIITVIISVIFVTITAIRYSKLSRHYVENPEAGINKKSFELPFHDGKIWCEHLDGMGDSEDDVITKFLDDVDAFSRPSVSAYMIINLDRTVITERIVGTIVNGIVCADKSISKIAFVGVNKRWQKSFGEVKKKGIVITFLSDYEKAKEWFF